MGSTTDTEVRNTRSVLTTARRRLANDESLRRSEPEIRKEISSLEEQLRIENESLIEITSVLPEIEAQHEQARLHFLTSEQTRESLYRELERAHLLVIDARLPQRSESARYILAQLLTEAKCLVCGNSASAAMESMKSRIHESECLICGSHIVPERDALPVDLASERAVSIESSLEDIDTELEAARRNFEEYEGERQQTVTDIQKLQTSISASRARVESLWRRLPPEDSQMRERRQELASLTANVEELQRALDEKRVAFEQIIAEAIATVSKQESAVRRYFSDYAHEFLLEECHLVWAPSSERLGQTGRRFDFPAFGLELGGSDFVGTLRRSGPDEVSESQREFIDISFRFALAQVATSDSVTSLVMDAPESSLDTVFVERAARVLGRFGRRETGNRLVVTSNLVAGDLIPELLKRAADEGDRKERVVDLFKIAAPTAAVRSLQSEYYEARDRLLNEAQALATNPM